MRSHIAYAFALAFAAACNNDALNAGTDDGGIGSTDIAPGFADIAPFFADISPGFPDMAPFFFDFASPPPPDISFTPDIGIGFFDAKTVPLPDLSFPKFDLAGPVDLTANGVMCGGGQTCKVGDKCCIVQQGMMSSSQCLPSCPDGNFSVACDGPEDCTGNPCCVAIMGGAPGGSTCTAAPNACPPQFSGIGSGQTRVCHTDGDCTSGIMTTQLNLCCTVPTPAGAKAHVCLNKMFAQFVGGSCP